jgi:hypothetical protein
MRFLCITHNHGSGTTALSQMGRQSCGGEAPGASAFFKSSAGALFNLFISFTQILLFFPSKYFLNSGVKITRYLKKNSDSDGKT